MDILRLIPGFWWQNRPTSVVWDAALNNALDCYELVIMNAYECQIGPFRVWIKNYPYAFGYNRRDPLEHIPRVRTRLRLRHAVVNAQRTAYERQLREDA